MLETIVDLAVRLNIDTFELGMLALFVFVFFFSALVLGALRKTEVFRQYESYFRLIRLSSVPLSGRRRGWSILTHECFMC